MMRIKSGVYGLNPLLNGGIVQNSTSVVVGSSGAGKTTMAIQFILRGLEMGEDGVFISLDENQNQIIKEAVSKGWDEIIDYLDKDKLVFIDASGEQFTNFIKNELPNFVADWKGIKARIVIDPLTPVLWAIQDRYEQREILSFLLKELRRVGTVLCTLEEHGGTELKADETVIPMYLADNIIHLRYDVSGDMSTRTLKVVKCRGSKHDERQHPYRILHGLGVVVQRKEELRADSRKSAEKLEAQLKDRGAGLPPLVAKRLWRAISNVSDADLSKINTSQLLDDLLNEYTLDDERE
jgi:KaiC/GvpD/RAD55 family RecA-like ATPase